MIKTQVQGRPFWKIDARHISEELPQLMPYGDPKYITLHWTAGSHNSAYAAYQILIHADYILVSNALLNWGRHSHTWMRNRRNIGVSFMGMAGGTEWNMGKYPINHVMIERAALVCGLLLHYYNMPWQAIKDHFYWAVQDGYKGYRWDVRYGLDDNETIYDAVMRKAKWYKSKQS